MRSRKKSLTSLGIRLREGLVIFPAGQRGSDYVYSPTDGVRAAGNITQPIQWSSEMYDSELGLVYYKTPDGCKGGWTCAQDVKDYIDPTKPQKDLDKYKKMKENFLKTYDYLS